MTRARVVVAVLVLALLPAAAQEGAKTEKWPSGEEIARRINARDVGVAASQTIHMKLIDKRGKVREREARGFRKYYGEEKKSVIFFTAPKNIEGTGFLTFTYPDPAKEDDQWLYLPAMRKVRRIAASNRGDAFLGTDFSYEEIKNESKVVIEDHTWKTVGEAAVDGRACYVLEVRPVNEKVEKELDYGRAVAHVDKEWWLPLKSELWDRQGNPKKVIYVSEVSEVQGVLTRHRLEAKNLKTGHTTVFTFSDVEYNGDIDDDLFTERMLRRGP